MADPDRGGYLDLRSDSYAYLGWVGPSGSWRAYSTHLHRGVSGHAADVAAAKAALEAELWARAAERLVGR